MREIYVCVCVYVSCHHFVCHVGTQLFLPHIHFLMSQKHITVDELP